MNTPASLNDPLRRRAVLASVLLHGVVLGGLVTYLLQPNRSSPPVANAVVFEFGGITKAPLVLKPAAITPAVSPVAEASKPISQKPVAQAVKPVPEKPVPEKPVANVAPRVTKAPAPILKPNAAKQILASQAQAPLPVPKAIKLGPLPGAPLPTLKPTLKPSEPSTASSADKPAKAISAQPEPVKLATVTAPPSSPEAGPATQAAATTSGAGLETERPTAPAASMGSTRETAALPNAASSTTATRETGLPTPSFSSTGSSSTTPGSGRRDTGLAGSSINPARATAETEPAGTTTVQAGSSSRDVGLAGAGEKPNPGSALDNGPAATKPAITSGSSRESGPATSAPKPAGPSVPETRGPSTAGPAGGMAGAKPSGSSAEGTGLSESSGTSAEGKVRRCAIVIDVRRITPPLRANMSPAILDPNGRKVWPDANAVQDVDSELVNETGIASFVSSPQAALALLIPGVNPLELRAIGTAMAEGVNDSSVRDYVVVSASDAERILKLNNCQVVFVK